VAEEQGVAVVQVRGDVLLVDLGLDAVRDQDHDDVGLRSHFGMANRRAIATCAGPCPG
jgi:hypothetical protein